MVIRGTEGKKEKHIERSSIRKISRRERLLGRGIGTGLYVFGRGKDTMRGNVARKKKKRLVSATLKQEGDGDDPLYVTQKKKNWTKKRKERHR